MGKGKTIVFLHGWGQPVSRYSELLDGLERDYRIFSPDLPGFGRAPLPRAFALDDYASELVGYLKERKIERPVIIGHSFGGRVAVKALAQQADLAEKLVLVASAGIERKSLRIKLLARLARILPESAKNILRPIAGSADYLEATGELRATMKNIVEENLEGCLRELTVPTLLVWGDRDNTTPIWQARLMARLIPDSKLVIIAGGDHGIPYRRAGEVAEAIEEFLK